MFPFSGAPTTELRGVHVPFVSPTFYPARMWTPNYFGALAGSRRHARCSSRRRSIAWRASPTARARERTFTGLEFASCSTAATCQPGRAFRCAIDRRRRREARSATGVAFTAQVVGDPAAGIQQVWVTYTGDGSERVDAARSHASALRRYPPRARTTEDSRLWKGQLATIADESQIRRAGRERRRPRRARRQPRRVLRRCVSGRRRRRRSRSHPLPTSATFGETRSISAAR